jgi:hypothetical protein
LQPQARKDRIDPVSASGNPVGRTFGLVVHLRPLTQSVYSANTIPSDEACVFDFQISLRDDYAGISDI